MGDEMKNLIYSKIKENDTVDNIIEEKSKNKDNKNKKEKKDNKNNKCNKDNENKKIEFITPNIHNDNANNRKFNPRLPPYRECFKCD